MTVNGLPPYRWTLLLPACAKRDCDVCGADAVLYWVNDPYGLGMDASSAIMYSGGGYCCAACLDKAQPE